jgi:hypothetical protein
MLRKANGKWVEHILDLSNFKNWNGIMSGFRITVAGDHVSNKDEYCFIEYIGFFKSRAEAEAYGGITAEQEAGKDLINLYYKGDKVSSRYKDLPSFDGDPASDDFAKLAASKSAETGTKLSSGAVWSIYAGAVALILLTGIVTVMIIKKSRKA